MILERHLVNRRDFTKKVGSTCDCENRFVRHVGNHSIIIYQHGAYNGDRKKGKAKGLPSEIEVYEKGKRIEKLTLHTTAREFDEWMRANNWLADDTEGE